MGKCLQLINSKETDKSDVCFQHVRPDTVSDQAEYLVAFCMWLIKKRRMNLMNSVKHNYFSQEIVILIL